MHVASSERAGRRGMASATSAVVTILAAIVIGCGPHPETAVVHVADAAPSAPAPLDPDPPQEPASPPAQPSERPIEQRLDPDGKEADRERARALFAQGAEAYAQGDFTRAHQAFLAAYELVPERALLFNIASCEVRLRDMVAACAHFRQYVAEGDPSDPRVQQVQSQVATRCGRVP